MSGWIGGSAISSPAPSHTPSPTPRTPATTPVPISPSDFADGSVVGSILGNFSVFVTGRYASGTAYSGCVNTQENSVLLAVDATTSQPCSTGDFTSEINGLRMPAFKALDARFTKSFGLGGLGLTAYADVRNLLNFTNIVRIFQGNNDIQNAVEYSADSSLAATSLVSEATANEAFDEGTGSIDLSFSGAGAGGCSGWV